MKIVMNKKCRMITAIALSLLLFLSVLHLPEHTYAAVRTGVVKCSSTGTVNTRASASTSAEIVNKLANGKPLTILSETKGSDGYIWYQVTYVLDANGETRTAYIRSDYVTITSSSDSSDVQDDTTIVAIGKINANNVYVRNVAGTTGSSKLVSLYSGDPVNIIGQTTVDGVIWYHVICTKDNVSYNGWVYGTYITINYSDADVSGDYAAQLRSAGFPDSYIPNLVALHNKYPNWTFEAVNTGLDWSTVISKESTNGTNLVQKTADDAKKSTATGAYNWTTNTWTIYDGSAWVAAHPDYIAYCMDPRNFLDETNIFMFESLSYRSTQNLSGVQAILNGSFMAKDVKDADGTTLNYAQAFVKIGETTGVSPYHLASRVLQEQGTAGTSPLISGTYSGYEGYYNYFNFNAAGTTSELVIKNGLACAKTKGWDTRYKSLLGGSQLLATNYIKVGQDTLYFQKFNVVNNNSLYGHQYMANVTAAITEGQKTAKGYTNKDQAFTFRIPVYKNMPEKAVAFTASGNPNNYLKTLSISGLSLTPAFSGAVTSYSLVVANSVSSVTVSASPVASTSAVSGTGTYNLAVGNNTIKVTCKSQSGVTKTYTITVARQAQSGSSTTSYSVKSSKYTIGSVVTGVSPGTTASDFLKSVTASNCTVKLLGASGSENTGTVGTGNKLAVYVDGSLKATYEVVIYGDVDGDGKVSMSDLVKINRHLLGVAKLTGSYLKAADTNKDSNVSMADLVVENRTLLGLTTIKQ